MKKILLVVISLLIFQTYSIAAENVSEKTKQAAAFKNNAVQNVMTAKNLNSENINKMLEVKSIEIAEEYNKLPRIIAQNKHNIKNR